MIDVLFSFLFIPIVCVLIWCYTQKIRFKILENIPGPKPYPIIGNLLDFHADVVDVFDDLVKLSKLYQPTAKFWTGSHQLNLLTTDPDLMKLILKSNKYIEKSDGYKFLEYFLGDGLITSKGSLWLKRRKMLNPAFHSEILKINNNVFNDRIDVLIETLSKKLYEGDIEVLTVLATMTTEAIIENSSGVSLTGEKFVEFSYFYKYIKEAAEIAISRVFSSWKWLDLLFRFHPDYKNSQAAKDYCYSVVRKIIEKRRQKLMKDQEVEQPEDDTGLKMKKIYLDIILSETIDNEPIADSGIVREITTVTVAGVETTAVWISFALYELSRNPDVQDKVVQEIREIFSDNKNHQPSIQDYGKMTYMELVLKEILRLYSPIPYIGRKLQEDVDYNGTVIPRNTNIYFFFYGMHRREDLYYNADKFDPERFVTGKISSHPYSFLPFGAGPRMCIGHKYAMYQGKCALSRLLMNFEVLPSSTIREMRLYATVTMGTSPEITLRFRERQFK